MLSISIGPWVLSIGQVLLAVAFGVALVAGKLAARRRNIALGDTLFTMALVGLLAARLVFVVRHAPAYLATPVDIIDIRDGGFDPLGGVVGMLIHAGWAMRCLPRLRRPLGVSLVAGGLTWGLTGGLLILIERQARLPDIELAALNGPTLDRTALIEQADGRPLVINLWATWCPPCREEMPVLQAAQARRDDLFFMFVNQGESREQVRRFLDREGLVLDNIVRDPHGRFAQAVGAAGLPTTLFYDANGRMVHSHIGPVSRARLIAALEALDRTDVHSPATGDAIP